jgi:hypothetical protein
MNGRIGGRIGDISLELSVGADEQFEKKAAAASRNTQRPRRRTRSATMGNRTVISHWEPSAQNLESGLSREEILEIVGDQFFDEEKYLEVTNGRERFPNF